MKLVSDNSPEEIAHREALDNLSRALRVLAANILRVVRGAGKSYEIGQQAVAIIDAMNEYRQAVGHYPSSHELNSMLSLADDMVGLSAEEFERQHAQDLILRGALQIAASRLIGQRTQESAGHSQMTDGLIQMEKLRARNRASANRHASKRSRSRSNPWDETDP